MISIYLTINYLKKKENHPIYESIKNNKHLGISLTKDMKDLYTENYKILMNKFEKDINK